MGTDPTVVDAPFTLKPDLSIWSNRLGRLSWPGSTNFTYELQASDNANGTFGTVTNLPATFPVTEAFLPYTNAAHRFFRVRATTATR